MLCKSQKLYWHPIAISLDLQLIYFLSTCSFNKEFLSLTKMIRFKNGYRFKLILILTQIRIISKKNLFLNNLYYL